MTALLQENKAEENTWELRLADGWYRGSSAAYGVTNVYGTQTSVIAQLEITLADGSVRTYGTDETWEWSDDGPVRFADLKDGENYDARKSPSYSKTARVVEGPGNGGTAEAVGASWKGGKTCSIQQCACAGEGALYAGAVAGKERRKSIGFRTEYCRVSGVYSERKTWPGIQADLRRGVGRKR